VVGRLQKLGADGRQRRLRRRFVGHRLDNRQETRAAIAQLAARRARRRPVAVQRRSLADVTAGGAIVRGQSSTPR
jgi:two-component sensor histidine kinase